MPLNILSGYLARTDLDPSVLAEISAMLNQANRALDAAGLEHHVEPADAPALHLTRSGIPYAFVHALRRVFALMAQGRPAQPAGPTLTEADLTELGEVEAAMESHLVCHADHSGLYLPQSLARPLFGPEVPAAAIGSAEGLAEELLGLAEVLEIELDESGPTDAALEALAEVDADGPWWRERVAWLALWEAAAHSLHHRTAVIFH